jgi:hypothetical protein
MWLKSFDRAIAIANSVDHQRLVEDAYRQRVIDMLQYEKPAGRPPEGRWQSPFPVPTTRGVMEPISPMSWRPNLAYDTAF